MPARYPQTLTPRATEFVRSVAWAVVYAGERKGAAIRRLAPVFHFNAGYAERTLLVSPVAKQEWTRYVRSLLPRDPAQVRQLSD